MSREIDCWLFIIKKCIGSRWKLGKKIYGWWKCWGHQRAHVYQFGCKIEHVMYLFIIFHVQDKKATKTGLKRSSETWLSLVKWYLIFHYQFLLQHVQLLLWWSGFRGWRQRSEKWEMTTVIKNTWTWMESRLSYLKTFYEAQTHGNAHLSMLKDTGENRGRHHKTSPSPPLLTAP